MSEFWSRGGLPWHYRLRDRRKTMTVGYPLRCAGEWWMVLTLQRKGGISNGLSLTHAVCSVRAHPQIPTIQNESNGMVW